MNKKGMTLVEIIVAISLISVVMVFLFQVLITVVNGNKRNNTKSKTLISKAIVMKAVEHDLDTFGLQDNTSVEECGTFDGISDSAKNQIIPIAARSNDYYCIKITYNPSNVKNSEGYLIFYQNNEKGFLAYKRGKTTDQGFIIESQVIREIDAIPKMLESNEIISKQNEGSLYSIKINFPIIATDGNNYDLTINYINSGNLDYPIPAPEEPITPTEKVTITIDVNGGMYDGQTNNVTIETKIGEMVQLSTPTKEGYIFKEWTIISGKADINENKVTPRENTVKLFATYESAFSVDTWETIASNIKSGNTSRYKVGDTKEVVIDGFTNTEPGSNGLYTVRIANNSTPSECATEGFSQTACGFVIEFVDVVEQRVMNLFHTNVGGWPASAMYKYLNGDTNDHQTYDGTNATLYSKLPSYLQRIIIDTIVVSGHGSADKNTERTDGNWESRDKLYLLTTGEIYSNCLTSNCGDTSSYAVNGSGGTTTRQLDYYADLGVTTSKYSGGIKYYNGKAAGWWLRASYSSSGADFLAMYTNGSYGNTVAGFSGDGLAPAFRIG